MKKSIQKLLSSVLVLLMITSSLPATSIYAADVDDNLGQVSVITGAHQADVNNDNQSKIVVTYNDEITLNWSAKDEIIERNQDGWWVGIKMTAPTGVDSSTLENATYQSRSDQASDWGSSKSFWEYKDSEDDVDVHYITLWAYVNEQKLNDAIDSEKNLVTDWQFDWDNNSDYEQMVSIEIDPSLVKLKKDSKLVYPSTNIGNVDVITSADSAMVNGNKSNIITVEYTDEITLDWAQADGKIGRSADGWWAGIKLTAPKDADIQNAKYKSKSATSEKWSGVKRFWDAKDSDDKDRVQYITLWAYVNEQLKDSGDTLKTQWYFDWNNDGVYEQLVNFVIETQLVTLDYSERYKLDTKNPEITISDPEGDIAWTNSDVTISGTIIDADEEYSSGISEAYYTKENDSKNEAIELNENGQFSFVVNAQEYEGNYIITAVDNSGKKTEKSISVQMDNGLPVLNDVNADTDGWAKDGITVTGKAIDEYSGISKVEYKKDLENENWNPVDTLNADGAFSFSIEAQEYEGDYIIRCTDKANNDSNEATISVKMDNVICVVIDESILTDPSDWTNGNVTISGTVSDNTSGVESVTYKLPNSEAEKSTNITYTSDDHKSADFKFVVSKDEFEGSGDVKITFKDIAGNTTSLSKTIKIDTTDPVIEKLELDEDDWTNQPVTISGEVSDILPDVEKASGIKRVEIYHGDDKTDELVETIESFSDGAFSYEIPASSENNGNYTVYCYDNAGNESHKTVIVKMDTTAPEKVAISYSNSILEEIISGLTFGFYKEKCVATLSSKDESSGIKEFNYSYGGNDYSKVFDDKDIKTEQEFIFEITDDFRGKISATATDKAGNTSDKFEDGKNIVVDNTPSGLTVTFNTEENHNFNFVNSEDETVDGFSTAARAYTNGKVTATITIDEANFFEGEKEGKVDDAIVHQVGILLTKTNNDDSVEKIEYLPKSAAKLYSNADKIEEFEWDSTGTSHRLEIEYTDDADYILQIDYPNDLSDNKTVITDNSSNSVDEGNQYISKQIVVDTIAPVIEVSYSDEKNDNRADEGYFLNRTATITVDEHNFDEKAFSAAITAKDILDNDISETAAEKALNANSWDGEGDIHTLTIPYTDDAVYTFALTSLKDYANNPYATKEEENDGSIYKRNTETPESFTVDETPSDIEISTENVLAYKILDSITFGFFDHTEVLITVKDATSGLQKLSYESLKTKDSKGDVAESNLTLADVETTNDDGKQIYVYKFTIDSEYKDSIRATVYDNSGNPNFTDVIKNADNEEYNGIIVDTTDPVFNKITYNEINSVVKDDITKHYYSSDAKITFSVNEEYFFENYYKTVSDAKSKENAVDSLKEDVELLITKDGADYYNGSANPDIPTDKFTAEFNESDSNITVTIPSELDGNKNDGDYVITLSYTDLTDHRTSVTTDTIVIDTTAPEITATYNKAVNTVNSIDYYNKAHPVGLKITVKEHNFDPEKFISNTSAKNITDTLASVEESLVEYCKNADNWNPVEDEKDTFVICIPLEDADANYVVNYALQDLALNDGVDKSENDAAPKSVTYDENAPEIEVTASTSLAYKIIEAITFGFFRPDVKLTITAKDKTAGISNAVISSKALNVENARDEFTIMFDISQAKNVESKNGVQTVVFEDTLPAKDYKNGITAIVYDYSKNSTPTDNITDEDGTYNGIIVDTTNPQITGIKYNEVNKIDDKYYYSAGTDENAAEYAVVEFLVNEEYFFETYSSTSEVTDDISAIESAVTVTITKDDYSGEIADYTNFVKEFDEENQIIVVKIPVADNDGDYVINLTYADPAGNEASVKTDTIIIDTKAPVVEISYENEANENRVGEGYFLNRTATITVEEHNFTPEYITASVIAKSIKESIDTKANEQIKTINDYGAWKHNGDVHTFTIEYTDDAIYQFALDNLQDNALNEMVGKEDNDGIFKKDTETPESFVVDKASPSDVVITYSDSISVIEDILSNLFWFYNPEKNNPCEVTLTTTDDTSGIQYFTYSYDGNDTVATDNTNGKEDKATGWKQDEEDLSKFTYTFTINPQFRGKVTATATDNSGNATKNSTESENTIIVDNISPEITVSYPEAVNKANGISYYDGNVVVTLDVFEENFMDGEYPDEVRDIQISADIEDENGEVITKTYQVNNWERVDDTDLWRGIFTLTNEGDYTIRIDYTDKSGNEAKTYTKSNITIDKTTPIVTVDYESTPKAIHTIDGRKYYDSNRSAVVTVVEHNFRASDFETKDLLLANNILGEEVTNYISYFKNENNWTTEGNTHIIKVDFKSDANYTFDFLFVDLAKNACDDYEADLFTVDKTAPKNLKVSYSANVFETIINSITFGYYDKKMTVTISADDETTGVYHFMYSYLTAKDVSSVNAQLINDAINRAKINQDGKTSTAIFTIPKSSLERNSQFNGTVEFTAYDYAENNTYKSDTKRVVVDNISPTSSITFNEPVQNANNVSYYAGNIDATISINEANFYSQDVQVIVTKDGSNYPVSVNWVDNSIDSHTGTFRMTEDGDYVVRIVYSDRSGNEMATYESNQLTIDTVDPVITVSGLNHQSANNGETIGFSISVTDKNIALSEFKPVLTAVIRNDNGELETITISLGDPVTSTNDRGETVYTYTVQNLSVDGFYSLTCSAVDYANHSVNLINSGQDNGTSANEETMNFSVNREGSTFWIETTHNDKYSSKTFTNELDKAYANDNVEIVVHELNVDLVNISNDSEQETVFALYDGSSTGYVTLQEGSGSNGNYVKNTLRGAGGWYETRYILNNDNFDHDGVYSFSILSYDRAGNSNLNTKDDSGVIKFTVDRTNPAITSNIYTDQVIDADSHTVEFDINDINLDKNTVEVILNGKAVPSELITSLGGNSYSFEMSTGSKQSVSVTSKDLAGNTADQYEINDVTVSTNRFVLFYYSHTLLFWIIVAGIVLLALLILFIVFIRKKDGDEDEEKA